MADFGFVGPSYEAPSIYQDAQECINFYPEIDPTKGQGGRGVIALYPTPGLVTKLTLDGDIYGNQEVRGMKALSGGEWLVVVVGPNVYSVNQSYVSTKIGTLTTTSGYVEITDTITSTNGLTAYIVDGENRYAWIAGTSTTVTLHYEMSGSTMYVSEIPCGMLYIGLAIGSYGTIESFLSGTGGIGTYTMTGSTTAGTVTGLNITSAGTGFTSPPIVTIDPPTASYGKIAIASDTTIKAVGMESTTLVNGGSGYTVDDVLTVSGGTFTTATTLIVTSVDSSGVIIGVLCLKTGSYTVTPSDPVSVTGGTGSGATFNINIVNSGTGYATNDVLTVLGGTGTAAATIKLKNVSSAITGGSMNNPGLNYVAGEILTLDGGTYSSQATFTIDSIDGSGSITGISLTTAGSYTALPSNPATLSGGSGTGATIDLTTAATILGYEILSGGSYTSIPTNPVSVKGGSGSGAQFAMSYGLNGVTLTNNGSFYDAAPDVTVEGGYGAIVTGTATDFVTATQSLPAWLQMPTTDGPWTGATVCDVVDNYVVYNEPGTQNWAATDLGSVVSQNAYYGTKDGAPDPIVSMIVDHRQVFLVGERTTEVWVDVGSTISGIISFPFQRVSGAMMQHGCAAANSVVRFAEQFMFVARDERGQCVIGAVNGYTFQRLSTHAVEQTLMNQDVSDAFAYTYQLEGHEFYVVTFPSINLTWVYDLASQMWHKWLSFDPETGYYRHRSNCGAFFNNVYLVGDFENGKVYQLDNNVYTEDGTYIRRLRRAPHLVSDLQRQYFSEMQIQFQPGVGLQTGQGDDPQAMLRWSNDGGSTWSNEHWTTIGKVGRYQNRAIWRRLGWSRDRIYEVSISDPVKVVVVSANLKAEGADN